MEIEWIVAIIPPSGVKEFFEEPRSGVFEKRADNATKEEYEPNWGDWGKIVD